MSQTTLQVYRIIAFNTKIYHVRDENARHCCEKISFTSIEKPLFKRIEIKSKER